MLRNRATLQHKLLVNVLGALFILFILDTAITSWTSVRFANLAHDRALHEIAREVFMHVKQENGRLKMELSPASERMLLADQDDRLYYRVLAPDGTLIGANAELPPARAGNRRGGPLFYDGEVAGEPVRLVSAQMQIEQGNARTTVTVQTAETLNKRKRLARDILSSVVIPQLLLIILATMAVYYGVARGLRSLNALTSAVSSRSHLHLSPIDTKGVLGEVRPLVDEVNYLMQRLSKTLDFQNRFIADAAHQLKTPVAGIKAQIELALRENSLADMRHSVAHLSISAERLSRLVGQLLSLARSEPGAADTVVLQPLDLRALALDVTMEWVPRALDCNVDLGFDAADEPVMVDGDAQRLRELISNLVDNAVRYSLDGGRVTVRVLAGDLQRLSISDDGPKIPVEERQRIFERFHRLLGTQISGSGLGLAIVSEIAALHKAQISLEEDTDGVGNTFTIAFARSAYSGANPLPA
jgi:two-component system sensor histidine kinase TctE